MADYKHTTVFAKVESLLETIRSTGIPAKADFEWMKPLGYPSTSAKSLPPILRSLGFVDTAGAPTTRWHEYRGPKPRQILGEAVWETYSELFAMYPDACSRRDAELENYFRMQTDGGPAVVKKLVGTFKVLCASADVHGLTVGLPPPPLPEEVLQRRNGLEQKAVKGARADSRGPSLHVDLQVHIDPESSPELVEQIFAAMAKHIYGGT